jgi:hypothetical protein
MIGVSHDIPRNVADGSGIGAKCATCSRSNLTGSTPGGSYTYPRISVPSAPGFRVADGVAGNDRRPLRVESLERVARSRRTNALPPRSASWIIRDRRSPVVAPCHGCSSGLRAVVPKRSPGRPLTSWRNRNRASEKRQHPGEHAREHDAVRFVRAFDHSAVVGADLVAVLNVSVPDGAPPKMLSCARY